MSIIRTIVQLLRETVKEWMEDGGAHIAAALAYYAVFSLSPLLIIVSLTLGLVADPTTLETSLVRDLQPTIGEQAANLIRSMLRSNAGTTDMIGTVVWLGIIVWGASGMFAQLQNALNKIWEVRAKPGRAPWVVVKNRLLSFGIVILAATTLMGTMVINAALSAAADSAREAAAAASADVTRGSDSLRALSMQPAEAPLRGGELVMLRVGQVLLTVVITTGLIAVVYRVLPDVHIAWADVIVGSIFTAVLLFIGQFLVGLYLARANIGSVFGAAGSLTVILVWIYYSAQILLFGAEFTEVWARHYGHVIRPDNHAVWVNESKARREAREAGREWTEIDARHREDEDKVLD